jgi:hypothetical protein
LASFAWLANSTGWRASAGYAGANIVQGPGATVIDISIDTDQSYGAYGSFRV